MLDVEFLLLTILFFISCAGLIAICKQLMEG
jgi:hypothetical protein